MLQDKQKKTLLVLGLTVALLLIGLVVWCLAYNRQLARMGLADGHFPWRRFSAEQLMMLYNQEPAENVPTTRDAEETHELFMRALRAGDWQEAVDCCVVPGKREEYLALFQDVESKGLTEVMIGDLSEIRKDWGSDSKIVYIYSGTWNGEKIANTLSFIKNLQGVWLIESF